MTDYERYYRYEISRFRRPTGWKAHFTLPKWQLQASSDPFNDYYFVRVDQRYTAYLKSRWPNEANIRKVKLKRWIKRCLIVTPR